MASAEAQLLAAIRRKKAQQRHERNQLRRRSALYRDQLVGRVAQPEYLVGGLFIGIIYCVRQQAGRPIANETCEELGKKHVIWREVVTEVLDRQLSRFLRSMSQRFKAISKDAPS